MSEKIKNIISNLGFKPKNGESLIYSKKYTDVEIKIKYNEKSPEKSTIDYDNIKCHRSTICNFTKPENAVHLECVTRLLNKGYVAKNIELEKPWQLGHKPGYLDILVKDENNKSFLMIDVKCWDKYESAVRSATNNEKDQIFSYLQQEPKTTKAICYYTSRIENGQIIYKNAIVNNKEEWKDLNQEERFNQWSKTWESNGIFEENVPLFKVESKSIRRKDLKELKKEDSDGIYNQFAEILRHNVVSDKPNAFNKIINLFLCKIWDEDRSPNEEVKFQTRTMGRDKTDEELLEDLNDLYKSGMKTYLEKEVSDYTKNDFEAMLNFIGDTSKKDEFKELYKTLRLYKNNEFAFKEVYDRRSFKDNAKVVREVVELLQNKQLRYSHKQQFLGDFFEKLLNDSIKQEAGQFFTPVPLTQFIIKSLPLEEIIKDKINKDEQDILPYVIDYACGTGHFLTEIMDAINDIIKCNIKVESISKPSVQKTFKSWQESDFEWAEKYIYGIDLDYRLVKASKISCFLNGDGKANLIHANGLAPFNCEDYTGRLHSSSNKQMNPQFNILIANPPYAIEAFKRTLINGDKSFSLYNYFTDASKEIECLFIERAKQLLEIKGKAGIVIPASIFINTGNLFYYETRKLLLKSFKIVGILALKSNAFMAADIDTLILFLERKNDDEYENISLWVNKFFSHYNDFSINGIEKVISLYLEKVYPEMNFNEYVEYIKQLKNIDIEKEKLKYFILTYNNFLVLANSGEKSEEKEFLGYEFSDRSGYEGINIYEDTDLFDPINILNPLKLNSYINKNYRNINISEDIEKIKNDPEHPLHNHIDYCRLSELINFKHENFNLQISTCKLEEIEYNSKYKLETLGQYLHTLESGSRNSKMGTKKLKEGIPSLGGSHIGLKGNIVYEKMRYIDEEYYHKCTQGHIKINDILVCKDGAKTGKIAFVDENYKYDNSMVNEHVFIIRADNIKLKQKYLFYVLFAEESQKILKILSKRAGQPSLNQPNIKNLKIPIPKNQDEIIKEIDDYFYSTEAKIIEPEAIKRQVQLILDKYLK